MTNKRLAILTSCALISAFAVAQTVVSDSISTDSIKYEQLHEVIVEANNSRLGAEVSTYVPTSRQKSAAMSPVELYTYNIGVYQRIVLDTLKFPHFLKAKEHRNDECPWLVYQTDLTWCTRAGSRYIFLWASSIVCSDFQAVEGISVGQAWSKSPFYKPTN